MSPRASRWAASAVAGAALATSAALASVQPASASASGAAAAPAPCSYAHLVVQPKVNLSVRQRVLPASVTTDCQAFDYVSNTWDSWAGVAGGVVQGHVIYATVSAGNGREVNEPPAVSDTDRLGVWTWTPGRTLPPLTLADLNTVRMDVRVGSVSYLSATRHGSTVSIATRAYRYWTSTHAFGTWGRSTGVIEWRTPGSTTWHGLKNVASDNTGRYTYRYTVTSPREYRVRMLDQTYVWGSSGVATTRV